MNRRRIMESQEIGEGVRVVRRFRQNSVFVQTGNFADGLRHQVIGVFDHVVAALQLFLGKVSRMAVPLENVEISEWMRVTLPS
jgi:hypothetical protein